MITIVCLYYEALEANTVNVQKLRIRCGFIAILTVQMVKQIVLKRSARLKDHSDLGVDGMIRL